MTHASQTKRRRSCSPTGTPAFGTRQDSIRDRHPANHLVPEPRLKSQVTWSAPTASAPTWGGTVSRIEIGDRRRRAFDASLVTTKYRSTSTTKLLPAKHSGGHLRLASPVWRPSQVQPVPAIP